MMRLIVVSASLPASLRLRKIFSGCDLDHNALMIAMLMRPLQVVALFAVGYLAGYFRLRG